MGGAEAFVAILEWGVLLRIFDVWAEAQTVGKILQIILGS